MPTLESALSESMQGSMSNELDESSRSTAQAGELNGLFTQADRCCGGERRGNLRHRDRETCVVGGRATRLYAR